MKMKRRISVLLAALLAVCMFAFAGCRKGDSGNTVTVGVANGVSEINIINTFRTAYMKENPGKNIKIVRITGNFDNQITKLANSKDLPDIIQVYDFSAEYWTEKGIYYPVSEYMARDGISESDYFESVVSMTKSGSDDKMYWAARDYNKVVVCVNTAMFKTAGVELPDDDWTWTDFRNICQQLNAKKTDIMKSVGQEVFYPVDMQLNWEAVYYPAVKSFGGDLIDRENGTALKNLEGIKQGFNQLLALPDEKLALEPTISSSPFPARQCAMLFTVRPNVTSYANSLKDAEGNSTIDFVSMPKFEGVETSYIGMGCTGYAITSQCAEQKREAAWDFIKFMITEKGQEAFCSSGAGIPVLKSMADDPNAAFRKYLPEANHDAFIQFAERDLPMNYMSGFKKDKHLAIRAVLLDELSKNLFSAKDRDAYYTQLKEKLESAMR